MASGATAAFQLGNPADQLNVTGTGVATFNSNVFNLSIAPGFVPGTSYTLVQSVTNLVGAGGVTFSLPGYTVTPAVTATTISVSATRNAGTNVLTWTGAGGNTDLKTAANWNPAQDPSVNGPYELVFAGAAPGVLTNSMAANTAVEDVIFTANNYNLTGNAITINSDGTTPNAGITHSADGFNTISLPLNFRNFAPTILVSSANGVLNTNGNIDDGNFTITVDGPGASSLTGILTAGTGGLTKMGLGTLTLGNVTNLYTGATTINNGKLSFPVATAIGSTTNPAILIAGAAAALPATLTYSGAGTSSFAANRNIQLGANSNANIVEVTAAAGVLQVDTGTFVMSGGAASTVALIKTGPGQFASNNGNLASPAAAFLGDVRILNGRLTSTQSSTTGVANTQLFGTGTLFLGDTTGPNGAQINTAGTSPGVNLTNKVQSDSGNTGALGILCTNTGAFIYTATNTITLQKDLTVFGTLNATSGQSFNAMGQITGTGNLIFQNGINTGTVAQSFQISNTGNNFAGNVIIKTGTVNTCSTVVFLGASGVIPDNSSIVLNGTGTTFRLNGFNETVGSISGPAGSVIHDAIVAVSPATLTVGNDNTSTSYLGTIIDGFSTSNLSLAKIGSGTLTLGGANAYTGTTTVSGTGGLFVTGVATAASNHTVNSGATLGGTGTILGTLTSGAGAIVSPGIAAAPGTLTTGTLISDPATIFNFRLNTSSSAAVGVAGNDGIAISSGTPGAMTINGVFNIVPGGAFPTSGFPQSFVLMSTTAAAGFTLGTTTLHLPGFAGNLSVDVTGKLLQLTVTGLAPTTNVWTGASTNGSFWSDPANWSAGTPVAGQDLIFPVGGLNGANVSYDVGAGGPVYNSLTISGTGYGIFGTNGGINLAAGPAALRNSGASNAIAASLAFAGAATITVDAGTTLVIGQIGLSETLTAANALLTLNSPGTLTINSDIDDIGGTGTTLSIGGSGGTVTLQRARAAITPA